LKDPGAVVVLGKAVDMPVVVGYIAAARYMKAFVDMIAGFDQHKRAVGRDERDMR
jgi:hypothetical protein